ncbi:MAG: TetR/AcrR family transcriptional regulator [Leptospira sp.]|jgi:TetR/AcrR family transcriptional repressor of nem operon|nr:TetR/AcrR family transcriptional regulator [Leptospira sp.]
MKGNLTKQRIISKGLALFNRYGIKGTSLSDLMAATQLEKGGIYRHFSSKEEILDGSIRYYISLIEERLAKVTDGVAHPRDRIIRIIESFIQIAENPVVPGGCFIMNLAVDSDFDDSGTHPLVLLSFKRWERLFVSEIQNGIKKGIFREDINVKDFAALAICSIEGSIVLAGVYPKMSSSRVVLNHLTSVVDSFLL